MRVAVALAAWAAVALVPACSKPRTPDPAGTALPDSGELTCTERQRAQKLCQAALRQRCESQVVECEAACARTPTDQLSANIPPVYAEESSAQCNEACRQKRDACVKGAAGRCPAKCERAPGQPLDVDGDS